MAENSKIEWTDHTFNPWMGCTKVSPACHNCYAESSMDHRLGKVVWGSHGTRIKTSPANWAKPLKWNRDYEMQLDLYDRHGTDEEPRRPRVFCASLADVFEDWPGNIRTHERLEDNTNAVAWWRKDIGVCSAGQTTLNHSQGERLATMDDLRRDLFALIDATPHLNWLLVTKRPENIERMWPCTRDTNGDGNCNVCVRASNAPCRHRANVWLGTSIENQEWADKRLPHLIEAKRDGFVNTIFVSAEPLRGEVDLDLKYLNRFGEGLTNQAIDDIDWVIAGGESGPGARPANPDWFRHLQRQCEIADTPFLFKQWGEFNQNLQRVGKQTAGRLLDGTLYDQFPVNNRFRAGDGLSGIDSRATG